MGKPGRQSASRKGGFCVWAGVKLGQVTDPQALSCKVVQDGKTARGSPRQQPATYHTDDISGKQDLECCEINNHIRYC